MWSPAVEGEEYWGQEGQQHFLDVDRDISESVGGALHQFDFGVGSLGVGVGAAGEEVVKDAASPARECTAPADDLRVVAALATDEDSAHERFGRLAVRAAVELAQPFLDQVVLAQLGQPSPDRVQIVALPGVQALLTDQKWFFLSVSLRNCCSSWRASSRRLLAS